MSPALLADMAAPQLLVAGGVMLVAAGLAVTGVVWLVSWLIRLLVRGARNLDSGDVS
jgi:hypothetical protein